MTNIKGWKDSFRLYFHRNFTDRWDNVIEGKSINFDLRDNKFYRELKNGTMKEVADTGVAKFFRGLDLDEIADSFEDTTYAHLMRMVGRNVSRRMKNFGTIFSQVESYLHYETYLLLDISFRDGAFSKPVSQFTKEIRLFMQESGITFGYEWENKCDAYPKLMNDLCTYVRSNYYMDLEVYRLIYTMVTNYRSMEKFNLLVGSSKERVGDRWNQEYGFGCEYKALFDYLVRIMRTEAQAADRVLGEYHDYLRMMREMEQKKAIGRILEANPDADVENIGFVGYGRIEKYPKYLTVRHNVVAKNYRDFTTTYDDLVFAKNADQNYSYSWGRYKIIVPKVSQDIKDEGTALHHCVASYVNRVIDGTTQIVFLREKDDESLVTVEIRANEIVQARGYSNRDITADEQKWLMTYAKAKNLNYESVKRDESLPTPTPIPVIEKVEEVKMDELAVA